MLREVNTDVLIKLKINAHQYIIAMLLTNKFYDHLESYLIETNSYDNFPDDLNVLAQRHLVAYPSGRQYDFKTIVVQPEFLSTLYKDDMFMELYEMYPVKVMRPNGVYDFLRKDRSLCKDLYYIITKDNPQVHAHIIACLRYELRYRERTGNMQWMKRLNKWLSGKEWENFEDLVANGSSIQPTNDYGAQLE